MVRDGGMKTRVIAWAIGLVVLAGCGARSSLPAPPGTGGQGGTGGHGGAGGQGGNGGSGCENPVNVPTLEGRVRDFHASHPDFEEDVFGDDPGIVEPFLGPDGKPVYAGGTGTLTTSGKTNFDTWYHDTPGVNQGIGLGIGPVGIDNTLIFKDDEFFPIDGIAFGNEGNEHNFHFTFEAHGTFKYKGGEVFIFGGDDDLFAFIDGRLVIDLGGVHGTETNMVVLDTLGLPVGAVLPLDIFFAERHTSGSTINVTLVGFDFCE